VLEGTEARELCRLLLQYKVTLISVPKCLTLSLLMSYIYMELLVKAKMLTLYIYGRMFGNAESHFFLFAAQCFNTESMQKVILCHIVCKHFASYKSYPNYRWDLIRYAKG
jgi:hypothetical protein